MRHRILIFIITALLLAGMIFAFVQSVGDGTDFERTLMAMEAERKGVISTSEFCGKPAELWLVANYNIEACLAEQRYPEKAIALFLLFGETSEFQENLRRFGYQQVIPVVYYFLENTSLSFRIRSSIGRGITALREGQLPSWEEVTQPLIPEERAWIAVMRIKEENNTFLGRFAIRENGDVHPLTSERVFAIGKELIAGGILSLERKYQMGEKVTLVDISLAGADVALGGIVGARAVGLLKNTTKGVLMTAKASKTTTRATLFSRAAIAVPRFLATSKMMRYGAIGLGAYLLFKHPRAFNAFLGAIGERLGITPVLFQVLAWLMILGICISIFWAIFGWLTRLITLSIRIMRDHRPTRA